MDSKHRSSEQNFDSEKEQLLKRLETTTTQLEEVLRKYHEAQRQARTDALTGLLNRRAFEEEACKHYSEYHRYGIAAGIILFDIDHFKQINDQHGHATGDRILKVVARTVKQVLRTADVLARWGGEEFIVGVQHMDIAAALDVSDRIREAVAAIDRDERDALPTVTVSLGVASLSYNDGSPDAVIERADKALYQAKERGRNRTFTVEFVFSPIAR